MRSAVKLFTTTAALLLAASVGLPAAGADLPSGERVLAGGHVAIEPAYNADTGEIMYLLTPTGAPFPSKSSPKAASPLYLVEYPPGTEGTFNCMGVPGNCPDHNGLVASVATQAMPSVYGTDPTAVPGHDHIADPPGAPDFNVAWHVIEVLWTQQAVDNGRITHLTTDGAIDDAVAAGDAIEIDLGFAFNCSVVPATTYWQASAVS